MHEWRYVPRGLASEPSCTIIPPLAGIVIKAERYLPAVRPTGRLRKSVRNTACASINRITRSTVASSRRSERPNLISSSGSSSRYFRMKSTGPTRGVVKGQYSVESARLTTEATSKRVLITFSARRAFRAHVADIQLPVG